MIFRLIKKIFGRVGKAAGAAVNVILLSIVYFLAIGLTSVTAKIFRKKFLDTKQKKETYWISIDMEKKDNYKNQF